MFPRLAASLLPLVYSLIVRYGARVRKPTAPEQLYIDFDGFFAACEEQADRRLQGRPQDPPSTADAHGSSASPVPDGALPGRSAGRAQ